MNNDKYLEMNFTDDLFDAAVSRRQFLKIAGGGIFIFMLIGEMPAWAQRRPRPELPKDFNAFLRIGEDGRVACFTGKIEMGQGVITSLAQMLADEIDVPLDRVDMIMGDTDLCPWDMGTFGSMSTRFFGPPLRAAAAEGRFVLKELASETLKTPAGKLVTENGVVFVKEHPENAVSYAELAMGKKIGRRASGKAPLKSPNQFKIMGQSFHRRDAEEKVTGRAKYAADMVLPGMLYAKVVRPPSHGAALQSINLSAAKKVPGVQIVEDDDLIAVLHPYPDMAEKALQLVTADYKLKESDLNERTIFDHLLKVAPDGEVVHAQGDLAKGEKESKEIIDSVYFDGYRAHAPIEPHAALAYYENDRLTVWPSSQTPFPLKDQIAEALDIKPKQVHVISPFLGGGFGGKSKSRQAIEAARLSKKTGKPVQVAYTREEEFFYDAFRPAAVVKIKSGIDKQGRLCLWDYHVFFAGRRGSQQFYDIQNSQTMASGSGYGDGAPAHLFDTGAWRAPANNTNTFARESQIDMMAHKAGKDPVQFRLEHLSDAKLHQVLQTAADKFGWDAKQKKPGQGFGVACGTDAGTSVATMAEVFVDAKTKKITVKRVICAQDMGLVINPRGATIQMEGCITMGLGYALAEELSFSGGKINAKNFDSYDIPRFSWLPEIETVLIDAPEEAPQGGGEPAIITMGAVIANAVFDAAGARVMQMPITPERIKKALKGSG